MTIAASDGLKLFIPQGYDIVWSLIILVIVALFFHKFFMRKFNAIFDERAAKIEGNIAKAAGCNHSRISAAVLAVPAFGYPPYDISSSYSIPRHLCYHLEHRCVSDYRIRYQQLFPVPEKEHDR